MLTNQDQVLTPAIRETERLLTGSGSTSPTPVPSATATQNKPEQYAHCMRSYRAPSFPDPWTDRSY
jgi:hypothetical protein